MIKVGSFYTNDLEAKKAALKHYFEAVIVKQSNIPKPLKELIFPQGFLSSEEYLVFPLFFRKSFTKIKNAHVTELCISGYLYFKYLICIDSLMDKDVDASHENAVDESILMLRAHTYHEESVKMLAQLFDSGSPFWKTWKLRNRAFLDSLLANKRYNVEMNWEEYKKMSAGKCSFLKAAADTFYFYQPDKTYEKLYRKIILSLDKLAIGRCLLDDIEDFKKDLFHKKNNYGHVLLNTWMTAQGKTFDDHSPHILEKYFYVSKIAEDMLSLSKRLFNDALDLLKDHASILPEYTRTLEAYRNKSNLVKVNTEAYRITTMVKKLQSGELMQSNTIEQSLQIAGSYINAMQNLDGSWYEVSNKQGLSNIWATAFISMHLPADSASFRKAADFLQNNRQKGLWGYNTDWLSDFDSTTSVLVVLNKASLNISAPLKRWFTGQHPNGGFSTYSTADKELPAYLGFNSSKLISGWTQPHVCVSAFAFYFLTTLNKDKQCAAQMQKLKSYLLDRKTLQNTWEPYWWTSTIYSTVFVVKGLINEGYEENREVITAAMKALLAGQQTDGSFKCMQLKMKSVFYTSLVMDTICQNPVMFMKYQSRVEKMKNWILTKQYSNGYFDNTNFLQIPLSTQSKPAEQEKRSFNFNTAGGTGFITGEIGGLFSTAVTLSAFSSYIKCKKGDQHD